MNNNLEDKEIDNDKKLEKMYDYKNIIFYVGLLIFIIIAAYYFYFCSSRINIDNIESINQINENSNILTNNIELNQIIEVNSQIEQVPNINSDKLCINNN
jgi:hypothetical protein